MFLSIVFELNISAAFLRDLQNNPGRFYHTRTRPKMKYGREQKDEQGNTKFRTISAPITYLKSIQKEINRRLQQIVLPKCMFGAVKEKNNIQNSLQHDHASDFFTVDLKNFFGNIGNKQVYRALRAHGYSHENARAITKLCTSRGCLPQGAPTSSTLANIVFAPTAEILEKFCVEKGITFTVFVDDLTFSAAYDFSYCTKQILHIISKNGFFPNYNKIHYRHSNCEITGLIVKDQKIYLEKVMQNYMDNNPGIKAYAANIARHYAHHKKQYSLMNL